MTHRTPTSTLFPYTTLFRSDRLQNELEELRQANPANGSEEPAIAPDLVNELRHPIERLLNRLNRLSDLCEDRGRSEEHTSELQSRFDLVCRLLLEKKKEHIK